MRGAALAARGGRDEGGSVWAAAGRAGVRVPARGASGPRRLRPVQGREARREGPSASGRGPRVLACTPVFVYFLMERFRVAGSLKLIQPGLVRFHG